MMKFESLTLFSADPASLLTFYSETLGLPSEIAENGSLTVQVGSNRLTFQPVGNNKPLNYHFAFNIPENQISEAADWLRERCELLPWKGDEIIHFEHWNAHSVYFHDPDGNILELIARHTLDNGSQEPFGSKSMLNVSELGIPVASVPTFCKWLQKGLGTPVYSGNVEEFAAMGDEQGLFIVVPEGRGWLPTGFPAVACPAQALVKNGNKGKDIRYNGRDFVFA